MTAPDMCGMTTAQSWPKVGPKSPKVSPNEGPKWAQSRPKVDQKSAQSRPRGGPKLAQGRPQVGLKLAPGQPQVGPESAQDTCGMTAVIPQVWDDRPVRPDLSSHLKQRYDLFVIVASFCQLGVTVRPGRSWLRQAGAVSARPWRGFLAALLLSPSRCLFYA